MGTTPTLLHAQCNAPGVEQTPQGEQVATAAKAHERKQRVAEQRRTSGRCSDVDLMGCLRVFIGGNLMAAGAGCVLIGLTQSAGAVILGVVLGGLGWWIGGFSESLN